MFTSVSDYNITVWKCQFLILSLIDLIRPNSRQCSDFITSSKSLLMLDNPADVWVSNLHKTLKYPVLMSSWAMSGSSLEDTFHPMHTSCPEHSPAQPSPTLLPPSRRIRNRHIVTRHTCIRLEYGMKNRFSCSKPPSFNQQKLTLMKVSVQKAHFPPHKQKPDAISFRILLLGHEPPQI